MVMASQEQLQDKYTNVGTSQDTLDSRQGRQTAPGGGVRASPRTLWEEECPRTSATSCNSWSHPAAFMVPEMKQELCSDNVTLRGALSACNGMLHKKTLSHTRL
eukprot:1645135-Amphidinium_carterae.1